MNLKYKWIQLKNWWFSDAKERAEMELDKELKDFYFAYDYDNEKDRIAVSNFLFFFRERNKERCNNRLVHDFPDFPCELCSPETYKEVEKARKWRKEQRELVGEMFEDRQNFDI